MRAQKYDDEPEQVTPATADATDGMITEIPSDKINVQRRHILVSPKKIYRHKRLGSSICEIPMTWALFIIKNSGSAFFPLYGKNAPNNVDIYLNLGRTFAQPARLSLFSGARASLQIRH